MNVEPTFLSDLGDEMPAAPPRIDSSRLPESDPDQCWITNSARGALHSAQTADGYRQEAMAAADQCHLDADRAHDYLRYASAAAEQAAAAADQALSATTRSLHRLCDHTLAVVLAALVGFVLGIVTLFAITTVAHANVVNHSTPVLGRYDAYVPCSEDAQ